MSRKDVWVSSSESLRDAVLTLPFEVREAAFFLPYYIHLERADPWSEAAKKGVGFVFHISLEDLLAYKGPILNIQFDDDNDGNNSGSGSGSAAKKNKPSGKPKPRLIVALPFQSSGRLQLPFRLSITDVNVNFVWAVDLEANGAPKPLPCLLSRTLLIGLYQQRPLSPSQTFYGDGKQSAGLLFSGSEVIIPSEFLCVEMDGYLDIVNSNVSIFRPPPRRSASTEAACIDAPRLPCAIIINNTISCLPPAMMCTNSVIRLQLTAPHELPGATSREREQAAEFELCYFRTLSSLIAIDNAAEADLRIKASTTASTDLSKKLSQSGIVIQGGSTIDCAGLCPWALVGRGESSLIEITSKSRIFCGTVGGVSTSRGASAKLHDCFVSGAELSAFTELNSKVDTAHHRAGQATTAVVSTERSSHEQARLDNLRIELLPLWYLHLLKHLTQPDRQGNHNAASVATYCGVECRGVGSTLFIEGATLIFEELQALYEPEGVVDPSSAHDRECISVADGGVVTCSNIHLRSTSACARVVGGGGKGSSLLSSKQCVMELVPMFALPVNDPLTIHRTMQNDDSRRSSVIVDIRGNGPADRSDTTTTPSGGHVTKWISVADTLLSSWMAPVAVRVSDNAAVEWTGGTVLTKCQRVGVRIEPHSTATFSNVEIHAAVPRCIVPTDDGGELSYVMGGRYPTTVGIEALFSGDMLFTDVVVVDFEVGFSCGTKEPIGDGGFLANAVPSFAASQREFIRCCVRYTSNNTSNNTTPVCCFAFIGLVGGAAKLIDCLVATTTLSADSSTATSDREELSSPLGMCHIFLRIEGGAVVEVAPSSDAAKTDWMANITFGQIASVGGLHSLLRWAGAPHDTETSTYFVADLTVERLQQQQQQACGGVCVYDGASADISYLAIQRRTPLLGTSPSDQQGSAGVMMMDARNVRLLHVDVRGFDLGFSSSSVFVGGVEPEISTLPSTDGGESMTSHEALRCQDISVTSCRASRCLTSFLFGGSSGSVRLLNSASSDSELIGCASVGLTTFAVNSIGGDEGPYVTEKDFLRM